MGGGEGEGGIISRACTHKLNNKRIFQWFSSVLLYVHRYSKDY